MQVCGARKCNQKENLISYQSGWAMATWPWGPVRWPDRGRRAAAEPRMQRRSWQTSAKISSPTSSSPAEATQLELRETRILERLEVRDSETDWWREREREREPVGTFSDVQLCHRWLIYCFLLILDSVLGGSCLFIFTAKYGAYCLFGVWSYAHLSTILTQPEDCEASMK